MRSYSAYLVVLLILLVPGRLAAADDLAAEVAQDDDALGVASDDGGDGDGDQRMGTDLGVALNVIDRAGDSLGARYFGGASFYYSLSKLGNDRNHFIVNLSALDFYDDIDFETGIGLGLLYRLNGDGLEQGSFTLSAVYGYNFMADDDEEGEYVLIGFGWSFGRKNK